MSDWRTAQIPASVTRSTERFVETFGGVYEHAAWVAEQVWPQVRSAEIATFGAVAAAMAHAVAAAPDAVQLGLLCAHPELAGAAALVGELTAASSREQGGAGLDRCAPAELAQIRSLNAAYRGKFGFPFIIAVSGMTRSRIIAAMARRLENSRAAELREALRQVDRIAAIRLAVLADTPAELAQ